VIHAGLLATRDIERDEGVVFLLWAMPRGCLEGRAAVVVGVVSRQRASKA
jgi:hypothetical protein